MDPNDLGRQGSGEGTEGNAMTIRKNMFYYSAERLDLSKMREECIRASKGDSRTKPMEAVIHMHSTGESCEFTEHETYVNGELVQVL